MSERDDVLERHPESVDSVLNESLKAQMGYTYPAVEILSRILPRIAALVPVRCLRDGKISHTQKNGVITRILPSSKSRVGRNVNARLGDL